MKIAFIGTHGVGKTTLCFDLASRLKRLDLGVDLVKEVARTCPLPINRDTTLEAQAWILHTQIAHEIAAAAQYEAVICDRSVLDNYAYLVHRIGRRKEYDALVREWVGTYSGLFKVPVLEAPSFDGTRDVSHTFQMEIDWVIEDLLEVFHVPCQRLDPAADRDGWVDAVLQSMDLPLEPPQIDLFASGA
ncbi:MAG: ATP-binding protein [Gemmatimonadota bacterium]|nr:ATP-binding protein [Gemmatimonadota bacterium]